MSGGHYSNKELDMESNVKIWQVPIILEALGDAFHVIDYDISGDTMRDSESEKKVYDIIAKLGERLFNT